MNKHLLVIVLTIVCSFGCQQNRDNSTRSAEPGGQPMASSRLAGLLGADATPGFPLVTEPRKFVFPDDHGPHPEYRNEWWYITGNLDAEGGERFGFELTFFRFALSPGPLPSSSAWRSNQVYVGHFALTDPANDTFRTAERYSRDGLGLAGARAQPFRVWLDDWELLADPEPPGDSRTVRWRLRAMDGDAAIDLALASRKVPVLNGADGLSQKSAEAGNASYYYSISRLATQGQIRLGERRFSVSGYSWLDREWGSSALSGEQVGWDWFALQFDDGSELMFYSIRRLDGSQDPLSAGTYVAADGQTRHLNRDDVDLTTLDDWVSPLGGRYPSRWRIAVADLGLDVEIEPILAAQELTTAVRYWEGAVDLTGTRSGQTVQGRGYVELTGYAQ